MEVHRMHALAGTGVTMGERLTARDAEGNVIMVQRPVVRRN